MKFKFLERFNQPKKPQPRIKHQWVLFSKSYASPVKNIQDLNLKNINPELAEKLLLGFTTYLWECTLTGDIRKEEFIGSDSPVLEDLMFKVQFFGPQYIKDENGKTFILDERKENIDPTTLPMRRI